MKLGVREYLLTLLLVALPVCTWLLLVRRDNRSNRTAASMVQAQENRLLDLAALSRTIDDYKADCAILTEGNRRFLARLPAGDDIDSVMKDTWRLAKEYHLAPRSIRTVNRQEPAGHAKFAQVFTEQLVVVSIEGDFKGFYQFLRATERQSRVIRVREMTICPVDSKTKGSITADLVISVYSDGQKQKDAASIGR